MDQPADWRTDTPSYRDAKTVPKKKRKLVATPILWIAICGEDAYRQKKIVVRMQSDKKKDKKRDKKNCGEDASGQKKEG